jgi:hypothetical protein
MATSYKPEAPEKTRNPFDLEAHAEKPIKTSQELGMFF